MYYYIVNPAAGGGAIKQIQEKLQSRLSSLGIGGDFAKTTGPGDATKMARLAGEKGFNTIVAVGGDDTVNEAINGVSRDNIGLGIVPIGRSNVLANRLGINSWQQACTILSSRRLTSFALIAAGHTFFVSTLTLGFETDLDKRLEARSEVLRQRIGQLGQSLGHAAQFQPLDCNIKVDDDYTLSCKLFSLSIANQKFLNSVAANKLVISISDMPSKTQVTTYLWRMLKRSDRVEDNTTTRFLANRLLIQTDPPTGIMVDGKVAGRTPIAIRLTNRRIKLITEKPAKELAG